jgi:hypothetical protein
MQKEPISRRNSPNSSKKMNKNIFSELLLITSRK